VQQFLSLKTKTDTSLLWACMGIRGSPLGDKVFEKFILVDPYEWASGLKVREGDTIDRNSKQGFR